MEFEEYKVVDSNGQLYRVGWDEHGWFTIQAIEIYGYADDDEWDTDMAETIEYQNELCLFEPLGDYPTHSFPPSVAEEIKEMI